jgi:carboxylesterase
MSHPTLPGAEPFTLEGGDTGVLLVHGFTGSPQGLRPWGEALHAAGLTVHCPLLPGHGTRWQDLAGVRWPAWAAAVQAAYEGLAAASREVVIGALSFGAALALHQAAHEPPRLRGLVLVNPYLRDRRDWRLPLLPLLKLVIRTVPGVGNDLADTRAAELAYDRVPLKAYASLRRFQALVVRELPRVRVPLLVYVARQDHVVDPANALLVADRAGSEDVGLVWLERSHHVATLDVDRQLVFDGTGAFVRRVTRGGT